MKTVLQLTDPAFQTQHSGKCDLHLEFFPKGMNYAVVDKGQDQLKIVFGAKDLNSDIVEISNLIDQQTSLSYHFRKVKISFHTTQFTLIPDELFEEDHVAEYSKFISCNEGDVIITDHIRAAKCVSVFAIPGNLAQTLQQKFHQPQFYHAANTCIEAGAQWAKQSEDPLVFLNTMGDFFEFAYFKNGKLGLYNSFVSRTADEFNYFILNLINTLKIEDADWVIAGALSSELMERLQKYAPKLQQAELQRLVKISETFEPLQTGHFYSLTALTLCE